MKSLLQAFDPSALRRWLFCLLPAAVGLLLLYWMRALPPEAIELGYSRSLFRRVSWGISRLSGLTRHSLAAIVLGIGVAAGIGWIVSLGLALLHRTHLWMRLGNHLAFLLLVVGMVLLLFAMLCAPNYHRPSFAAQSGLAVVPSERAELVTLCLSLRDKAAAERQALYEAAGEVFPSPLPFEQMAQESYTAFCALEEQYPFLGKPPAVAKAFPASTLLSRLNLTGFYFPYTAEANVNAAMPETEQPFTICHELAHTVGMMREDEANFIGYLACKASPEGYLRYSGYYAALQHSMNALYRVDSAAYRQIFVGYSPLLRADWDRLQAYWQPFFDTPAAAVSNQVNDAYLKANALPDGVESYGRMVDLLLAEQRQQQNEPWDQLA